MLFRRLESFERVGCGLALVPPCRVEGHDRRMMPAFNYVRSFSQGKALCNSPRETPNRICRCDAPYETNLTDLHAVRTL